MLTTVKWVGVDLDHTLVRYELSALLPLIYESLVSHVSANPALAPLRSAESALRAVDVDAAFCQKGLVLDFETGDFLKLDDGGVVRAARHGFRAPWLEHAEIVARYGETQWHGFAKLSATWKPDNALCFMTYFDVPAIQICAILVDEIDRIDGAAPSAAAAPLRYRDIAPALFAAFGDSFDAPQYARGAGGYFPTVRRETRRFVRERADVAAWIQTLRARDVRVFIVTNSAPDYAQLLLESAFGAAWRELFDFCVYSGKKKAPRGFFACSLTPDESAQPFLGFDRAAQSADGAAVDFAAELSAAADGSTGCVELVGGNWIEANAYMLSSTVRFCLPLHFTRILLTV